MSKRLDAVLRVGHEFQGAQSETSHTGVDPSIAKPRGGDRIFGPQRFEQPPPSPPKIFVPSIKPLPPSVSITTPDLAAKIVEAANAMEMQESELAQMANVILACVHPKEPAFLASVLKTTTFRKMTNKQLDMFEADIAKYALSQDRDGILGPSPTLMECVYFFGDPQTLLAIRHLEDPCAVEDFVEKLPNEVRRSVFDRAAKIRMIAGVAYKGGDAIRKWKRGQTLFFASLDLDEEGEQTTVPPTDAFNKMGISNSTASGMDTLSTQGAALQEALDHAPENIVRYTAGFYAFLLLFEISKVAPQVLAEFSLAREYRRCRDTPTMRGGICEWTSEDFAERMFKPRIELNFMRTLTVGMFTWPEVETIDRETWSYLLVDAFDYFPFSSKMKAPGQIALEQKLATGTDMEIQHRLNLYIPFFWFSVAFFVCYHDTLRPLTLWRRFLEHLRSVERGE